ncbi:hypothetical protein GCM10017744_085540 [Streptomyces antimycoticus]|uniref:Uncharacterized protein n=1 Tax=Streptomyces antimycoticus TaxID=68175 RepID=A0A4D4K0V6_9ACTN|nr:hypothetical protein SANT12839_015820 [Streptomyces antimycoticus]
MCKGPGRVRASASAPSRTAPHDGPDPRALTGRAARTTPTPKSPRERTWKHLSPLLRLLILTQLAFNIGFFAVLPFLAEHLGTAIGMAGWMVGFVLGLRTLSTGHRHRDRRISPG